MSSTLNPRLLVLGEQLDEQDRLGEYRGEFYLQAGQIYLDGNSLGVASKGAERALLGVLEEWKSLGIEGWTTGRLPWLGITQRIAELMAPLMGALPDEIAVGNSTTVNLHQLLATLYRPGGKRRKILVDELSFPSNLYAIRSHLKMRGLDESHLEVVPGRDGFSVLEEDIIDRFSEEIAIAVLPSVLFAGGQLLDMERLSEEASKRGIMIGFDCSHSVGALPHELDRWGTDFAYWCTYKYLNSGPGGSSALYLNRRHFGKEPGMAGWFGSRRDRQFDFSPEFKPADTAQALEIATPNIFSMAPLLGSLELVNRAGIGAIREKSIVMTEYLIGLFDQLLAGIGFELVTPRDSARRGGHISVLHAEGARICLALRKMGVVTDFRPPSMIRITPAPLYVSFVEVYEAVSRLHEIVVSGAYENQASDSSVI